MGCAALGYLTWIGGFFSEKVYASDALAAACAYKCVYPFWLKAMVGEPDENLFHSTA